MPSVQLVGIACPKAKTVYILRLLSAHIVPKGTSATRNLTVHGTILKLSSYVESLEKTIRRLETTIAKKAQVDITTQQAPAYHSELNEQAVASQSVDADCALRRFGKSSAEHFALTLEASAQSQNVVAGGFSDASSYEREGSTRSNLSNSNKIDDLRERPEALKGYGRASSNQTGQKCDPAVMTQRQVKYMIETYFEAVHPIWPILLEKESRQRFEELPMAADFVDSSFAAQYSLVISLACQHFEGRDKQIDVPGLLSVVATGNHYYHRARLYLCANAFKKISTSMLQAFLLLAIYQQGSMQFHECYITVGHAARIAQCLGFHISRPDKDTLMPLQRELRRRLWWACFCLDR